MNTKSLNDVAFLTRALPVRKATRGSNFAPRDFGNVSMVRSNPTTFLKEKNGADFVKVS